MKIGVISCDECVYGGNLLCKARARSSIVRADVAEWHAPPGPPISQKMHIPCRTAGGQHVRAAATRDAGQRSTINRECNTEEAGLHYTCMEHYALRRVCHFVFLA